MPITHQCPNGHKLLLMDEHAGKTIPCPICRTATVVPDPRQVAPPPAAPVELPEAEVVLVPDPVSPVSPWAAPPVSGQSLAAPPSAAAGTHFCPNGHKLLLPPSQAQRTIACPICKAPVTIAAAAMVVTLTAMEPEAGVLLTPIMPVLDPKELAKAYQEPIPKEVRQEAARHARERRAGLDRVNLGLGFHYARMLTFLILFLLSLVFTFLGVLGDEPEVVAFGMAVNLILGAAASLLAIAGSVFCLWVPAESGARVVIAVSLILDILTLPLSLAVRLLDLMGAGESYTALVASVPVLLLGTVSWILFMVFLRQLAKYLNQETEAEEAMQVLAESIILVTGGMLFMLVVILLSLLPFVGIIFAFAGVAAAVYFIVRFLFRFLNLVASIRQIILYRS